jgi:hypothetical protein
MGLVPLSTAVCVTPALGRYTCASLSRRKCDITVCVECVFLVWRFASCKVQTCVSRQKQRMHTNINTHVRHVKIHGVHVYIVFFDTFLSVILWSKMFLHELYNGSDSTSCAIFCTHTKQNQNTYGAFLLSDNHCRNCRPISVQYPYCFKQICLFNPEFVRGGTHKHTHTHTHTNTNTVPV